MEQNSLVDSLIHLMETFRANSMQNNIYFARKNSLSISQLGTLFRLYHTGSCSITVMGDELGISTAAVSQMLEKLVQQGLLRRTEAAHDRRARQIMLTEKGRQMVETVLWTGRQWLVNLVSDLDADQKQKTLDVINLLVEKSARISGFTGEKRESQVCCD